MKNRLRISLFVIIFTILNFPAQNFPQTFEEHNKYGVRLNGTNIIPAIYDNISTDFLVVTKKGNEFDLYDNNLVLLDHNIKTHEYFVPMNIFQIITRRNEIKTYNYKGQKVDISQLNLESQKNLFIKNDKTLEHYIITNTGIMYERKEYFGKENYPRRVSYKLIKNGKDAKFLNNGKSLEILSFYNPNIEDYFEKTSAPDYNEETLFKPLKHTYIVVKVGGKYGVWDFKEEKTVIPFDYKTVIPHQNYLYLEKDGMCTFYPNIGTEPKYKKLEPYIGAFARFETPDGKKGWVDRKGKEYFDQ